MFLNIEEIAQELYSMSCRSKPTYKHHARIKDKPYHKLYWKAWFYFFIAGIISKPSFRLSSPQIKDKRMEGCWKNDLVLATCLRPWLSLLHLVPAKASRPQPLPPLCHSGHGWHSPPPHPSVYSLCHSSNNDSFTEAAVRGWSKALSSSQGMQLSCLHISTNLETSSLIEPLSFVFSHPAGITIHITAHIHILFLKSTAFTLILINKDGYLPWSLSWCKISGSGFWRIFVNDLLQSRINSHCWLQFVHIVPVINTYWFTLRSYLGFALPVGGCLAY